MVEVGERGVRFLLLDIEGTTTPVDFVHQTLFPYAHRMVERFLREHWSEAETSSLIKDLRAQHEMDQRNGMDIPPWKHNSEDEHLRSTIGYARWLMGKDSKCTPLKSLQGKIWEEGYRNGQLHGQVYPDVPRGFERWRRQGREICIYSSGSVLAQQLLFRTVCSGDLTPHISGFFDTRVGSKNEAESYRNIADSLGRATREFLFVSDATKEIEAAKAAGMAAILCDRSASSGPGVSGHTVIHSFDEVFPA